jgi:uncharacterized protein YndB with AHSA1/START domain
MNDHVRLDGDQLIASRHIDADQALVWEAFTTPKHLAAFWGGHHAIIPSETVTVDLRVGGTFDLETRGTDGGCRRLQFRYEVIDAPSRLVLAEPSSGITTDIRLQPTADGTTITVHQRRLPPELQTEQARTGMAGILEQLDHLVRTLTHSQRRQSP